VSAAAASPPIVAAEELRIHFPTGRRHEYVHAVDGVSFSVREGETFGLIGESGSGKSTLARALVCLARPTSGRVLHRGVDPFAMRADELRRHRRQYQIIFQDPNAALDPRMSAGASICEPMELARLRPSPSRCRQRCARPDAEFAQRGEPPVASS
jgi:peptide/nickel transport system ATP-binding protein/oligopeptide transport system ATP-binding protein